MKIRFLKTVNFSNKRDVYAGEVFPVRDEDENSYSIALSKEFDEVFVPKIAENDMYEVLK